VISFLWYLSWSRERKAPKTVIPAQSEADLYFQQFNAMIA
jgi:hypothetical protein